jgi:mRNA interferase MazF
MTIYEPFAVVDVPFPFIDSLRQKNRAALVLSNSAFQKANGALVLAMITSAERSSWKSDAALANWRMAGLRKPCVIRWKLFTLDAALIRGLRGHLSDRDRGVVKERFGEVFSEVMGKSIS